MKKTLIKKLELKKETITRLNNNDMYLIRGATLIFHCTESCTIIEICCPTTEKDNNNIDLDKGKG